MLKKPEGIATMPRLRSAKRKPYCFSERSAANLGLLENATDLFKF